MLEKHRLFDEFDDLPGAPEGGAAAATPIDASGDAAMFEGVAKKGELFPAITAHFRVDRIVNEGSHFMYTNKSKTTKKTYSDGSEIDAQPYFQVFLSCQQEPHTGKGFVIFVGWPSAIMREKAKAGDAIAQKELKDRLIEAKALMTAAEFTPPAKFDFKQDFLLTNPEMKVQVGIRKGRDGAEDQNTAVKYFSLRRPS